MRSLCASVEDERIWSVPGFHIFVVDFLKISGAVGGVAALAAF